MVAARKQRKTPKVHRSRRFVAGAVILGLIIVAAGGYMVYHKQDNNSQDPPAYSGPTDDEKRAADEQKERLAQDKSVQLETNDQGKQVASVIITDAGQYDGTIEVRAYMPNSYEAGTCTVTFTKGSEKVQKTSDAFVDSSYTICTKVAVPRSEFASAGSWKVTVVYSSEHYSGTVNQSIEIL